MTNRRTVWMRSAGAAVALVWVIAVLTAQCWVPQFDSQPAHPNHPLVTALGSEFSINVDHGHLADNSHPLCSEHAATVALPEQGVASFNAASMAAADTSASAHTHPVVSVGRGPPGREPPHTGQDLLTRFCLSRR